MKYIEDFHTIKKVTLVFFGNKIAIGYSLSKEPEIFDIDKKVIRWLKTYAGNIMVTDLARIASYNIHNIEDINGMKIIGNQHISETSKVSLFDDSESKFWRMRAWNDHLLANKNINYLVKTNQVDLYRKLISKSLPARMNATKLLFEIDKKKELDMHAKLESGIRSLERTPEAKDFIEQNNTNFFSPSAKNRKEIEISMDGRFVNSEIEYLLKYCEKATNTVLYKDPPGYKLVMLPVEFHKKPIKELLASAPSKGYMPGHLGTKYYTPFTKKNGVHSSASKQKVKEEINDALAGVTQSELLHTYKLIINNPHLTFVKSIDRKSVLFMEKIQQEKT